MNLPEISNSKVGIIYVYYERKNQQKNQTNLAFFIKYGLNETLWAKIDIETLFVVNGHRCEVMIPSKPNINILYEDNCSDWEGWYNGIKFYENKYNKSIWQIFDYLCLVNAGAFGPIYEENIQDHWLMPFYNKMVKDGAVICTPCMSFLNEYNACGPGPKVIPIFSLLRCTEKIMNLLMNTQIKLADEYSINEAINNYQNYNTILGKKSDKTDAILSGEYGLSRILNKNGFKITSLLYDFNCYDFRNWNINNNVEPDRYNSFNGTNIPLSTIFIKNIWRIDDYYASMPLLYHECKEYFYRKLNMKSIFNNLVLNFNYDLLHVRNIDIHKGDWYSKEEYYKKFGHVEETILFNKPSKHLGCSYLIYAHYDSNNIVMDYVIKIINTFTYLGYKILFFTSSKSLINIDNLPCEVFFVENTGSGTDWRIWLMGCNYLIKNNFNLEYVFLLNDSVILPIHGVDNFENTIKNMRNSSDFWGHWESNEIEWHIVGCPIEFKYTMINDVISFIENNISICNNKADFITKLEVKFAKYLVNKGYKCNSVVKSSALNNNVICPVFNPINLFKWINEPSTFAIKWKYSLSYLNSKNVSQELNYLTQYLIYGKYGVISYSEKIGLFSASQESY